MNKLEDFKKGDYGFLSLSDTLDRFMMESFNNGQKYYKNLLSIAQRVYKEIYWKTLRYTKTKRISIDLTTMTVRMPLDCLKLISVKVIDRCNNRQPLSYNAYKNVVPVVGASCGCGCATCHCDNLLCKFLDNGISHVFEEVILNNLPYQRTIKTKVCPNGDLTQEITEPMAVEIPGVPPTKTVQFFTITKKVASLTLKPCGCVEATPQNAKACYDYAGCPVELCCEPACDTDIRYSGDITLAANDFGRYKVDEDNCTIYLLDTEATLVEVTYITNGEECATEIMIPEYCLPAMLAGIYLGSIRFRQAVPSNMKRDAKQDFVMEQQELYEFLNPIVEHDFLQLQHYFFKW